MKNLYLIEVKIELQLYNIQMNGFINSSRYRFIQHILFDKTHVFEDFSSGLQTVKIIIVKINVYFLSLKKACLHLWTPVVDSSHIPGQRLKSNILFEKSGKSEIDENNFLKEGL